MGHVFYLRAFCRPRRTRRASTRPDGSRLFFVSCGGRLPAERDGEDKNEKQRESPGARDVRDAGRPLGALKLNVAGSTIRAKPSNCRVDRTVGSEGLRIEWKVGPRNPDETFEIPCRRTSGSTPFSRRSRVFVREEDYGNFGESEMCKNQYADLRIREYRFHFSTLNDKRTSISNQIVKYSSA